MTSIYDFTVADSNGTPYSLDKYRGSVVLIVNTATKCGLRGQFEDLEKLYQTYKDQGFVVLGFPSNQFHQELADGQAANESCRLTYGVTFPMHDLTVVNGKDTHPLFAYLKEAQPGLLTNEIKWNFTKFLVDRNGHVSKRYSPKTDPMAAKEDILSLLTQE